VLGGRLFETFPEIQRLSPELIAGKTKKACEELEPDSGADQEI